MKSQGYFLVKKGKAEDAFELKSFDLPALNSDEVLIEVEAFGLNYADVMARLGLYLDAPPFPALIGYEVVGRVIEVSNNSKSDLLGKRVLAFTRFGGYAKHAITQLDACVEVGEQDAAELLALCTQGVTAFYMASFLAPVRNGDVALVHAAAGGVGSILIQLIKEQGGTAIAKVGGDAKMEFVRNLGAELVVNYRKEDYQKVIEREIGNIDVSFNPVGGSTYKKDFALTRAGGRIFLFGGSELGKGKWGVFSALNFVRKMGFIIPVGLMMRSRNILGVNMLRIADEKPQVLKACLEGVLDLYTSGKIKIVEKQTFPASEIAKAHSLLESGNSKGKLAIKW